MRPTIRSFSIDACGAKPEGAAFVGAYGKCSPAETPRASLADSWSFPVWPAILPSPGTRPPLLYGDGRPILRFFTTRWLRTVRIANQPAVSGAGSGNEKIFSPSR